MNNKDRLVMGKNCVYEMDENYANNNVMIVGGTGSGKTTLIQLISRLYDATEGSVKVGRRDVREYDLDTLRNAVSVVLQKNLLFSGTIKDNLRWGNPDATDEEMEEACRLAQADSFIKTFEDGYDTYIEQGGTNVSGGQKQRAAVARAIITQPKLLLADEPTGALDSGSTDELLRLFAEINRAGQTILMVTHSVKAASRAGRVLFIKDGQVSPQLSRGEDSDTRFYQRISDTLTMLQSGGEQE